MITVTGVDAQYGRGWPQGRGIEVPGVLWSLAEIVPPGELTRMIKPATALSLAAILSWPRTLAALRESITPSILITTIFFDRLPLWMTLSVNAPAWGPREKKATVPSSVTKSPILTNTDSARKSHPRTRQPLRRRGVTAVGIGATGPGGTPPEFGDPSEPATPSYCGLSMSYPFKSSPAKYRSSPWRCQTVVPDGGASDQ